MEYLNDAGIWLPFATVIGLIMMFGAGAGFDRVLWRPLRHRGSSLISMLVVSIGVSLVIRYLVLYIFGGRPKAFLDFAVQKPYDLGPITMVPKDLWSIGLSLIVLTSVGLVLTRTRTGKSIRAVADNPDLARSSGIDVDRVILVVWGAGASLSFPRSFNAYTSTPDPSPIEGEGSFGRRYRLPSSDRLCFRASGREQAEPA